MHSGLPGQIQVSGQRERLLIVRQDGQLTFQNTFDRDFPWGFPVVREVAFPDNVLRYFRANKYVPLGNKVGTFDPILPTGDLLQLKR